MDNDTAPASASDEGTGKGHVDTITQHGIGFQHGFSMFQYSGGLTGKQGLVNFKIEAIQ